LDPIAHADHSDHSDHSLNGPIMKPNSLVSTLLFAGAAFAVQDTVAATVDRTRAIVAEDDGAGGFNAYFGDTFAAFDANGTFTDVFTFDTSRPFDVAASLTSVYLNSPHTEDLDITAFSLYRYDPSTMAVLGTAIAGVDESRFGANPTDAWSLSAYGLRAGAYALRVDGRVRGAGGGTFGGDLAVAPVPEPQTWSMLLAGLGMAGALAQRRKG
jgi:hypothetical protein